MKNISVVTEVQTFVVAAGEQGPPGPAGDAIDDGVVSLDSTFSSQHIMELLNPLTISSFALSQTTAEMGETITSEHLSWSSNYVPDTLSINQGIGLLTPSLTSYDHTGQSITTNRTYTLTMVKSGVTKTANATLTFLNQYYYGVNPTQTTNPGTLQAMTHVLASSRGRSITFDCTGGRFFHIAYPSRLGAASFTINNLVYSDTTLTVVSLTNASGFSENYNVYYCNVIQNGAAITLVVS